MTASGADRVPAATGKAITVAFTLATALAPGDKITLNFPSGFFAPGVTATPITGPGTPTDVPTAAATGATSVVLTVAAGRAVTAAAQDITLGGLTL